jgi:DNA polymerase-3 subunit epsilon
VYLRRRGGRWSVVVEPTPLGPLPGKRLARAAARALDGHESDDVLAALPLLRARLQRLGRELRFEDAARLRDRVAGLEEAIEALRELERLRALSACLVVPARQPGFVRAHAVAGGRVAAVRLVPRGPGAAHEIAALVAEASRAERSLAPEDADELRLVGSFLRRPPPELRVARLDAGSIRAAVDGIPLAA